MVASVRQPRARNSSSSATARAAPSWGMSAGSVGGVVGLGLGRVVVGLGEESVAITEKIEEETDLKKIINCFENNIHPITQIEFETILDYQNDFEDEAIILAITEAVTAGARNMKYLKGILNNWHSLGLHTKTDVEAHQRDWMDKKQRNKKSRDKPNESVNISPIPKHDKYNDEFYESLRKAEDIVNDG